MDATDRALISAFDLAMVGVYRRALAETGYKATLFLSMVSERGGLDTARYLLGTSTPSVGYVALWERGRLDITVEAVVLDPRWRSLFTDEELMTARQRLLDYRFDVDGYTATLRG